MRILTCHISKVICRLVWAAGILGVEVVVMTDQLRGSYDVVVAGGGAAGLNGALMLARSRRTVVVIDAGDPRNAPAAGVHGLLARDGTPPAELLDRGRADTGWVRA